jgi:hypothetical protein
VPDGYREDLGDFRGRQRLPEVQLEQDLVLDRDPAQRFEQNPLFGAMGEQFRGARPEVMDRGHTEVDLVGPTPLGTIMVA